MLQQMKVASQGCQPDAEQVALLILTQEAASGFMTKLHVLILTMVPLLFTSDPIVQQLDILYD